MIIELKDYITRKTCEKLILKLTRVVLGALLLVGCTEKGPVIDTENTRDTQKDSPVTGVPIAKRVQKIYSNGESLKVVESTVYASFVDGEIGFLLQTGDAAAGYMQKMLWTTSNGGVNWEEDIFTLAGIQ